MLRSREKMKWTEALKKNKNEALRKTKKIIKVRLKYFSWKRKIIAPRINTPKKETFIIFFVKLERESIWKLPKIS